MRFLALAAAALALAGCTVDKGRCLQSHVEHVPDSMTVIPISTPTGNGGVSITMMPIFTPAHDVTICDRYEFPEGKPK